jgi:DNA invertase Pin-like site-specific DNA recombinase
LLDEMEAGDVLVVSKLDRLARSALDLLRVIERIGKAGASFQSLGEPWADTTTPHGRLMLTVLGGVADYADSAVMRSWAAGMQAWPGFQRRGAPHNPGPPRRVSP